MAYTDIDKPSDYFNTVLWTGNGSGATISGVGFQPDWVWEKSRSDTYNHNLIDSVRGANKVLEANNNESEATKDNTLMSFNSDGFVYGANAGWSNNGSTFVAWNWKKQAGVFDIQTYTGNGSNRTISHNLGTVPKMMIIKKRNTSAPWSVGHASLGANQVLELDATDAVATDNSYWNNTRPTSSVFSLGTDGNQNTDGHTYVIYLFGNKQGMSNMGSYIGNGNADGSFVFLGFKPAFIIIKKSSNAGNDWYMWDNKRNTSNLTNKYLNPDLNAAEGTANYGYIDFLSNGFKTRATGNTDEINQNGHKFIYMAFAENPFVTSTGVPATAR